MRAFIAIELPPELKDRLASELDSLRSAPGAGAIRWSNPDTVHLTLRFLGELDDREVALAQSALEQGLAGEQRFSFQIERRLGCFPSWQRPRVFWIGVGEAAGRLGRLNGAIERQLRERGFQPEHRAYHPHLTIGRVKRGVRPGELRSTAEALQEVELDGHAAVQVRAVSLMESELRPSGAVHTPVYQVRLSGSEA